MCAAKVKEIDLAQSPGSARTRPIEILLVEDSQADIVLTQEAFRSLRIANRLHVAMDGRAALDHIYRRGQHEDAVPPDLILLDLNLPVVDGRTVLETLKNDPLTKHIPVIVMTTSRSREDVEMSYAAHANSFIRKPIELAGFMKVLEAVEGFWLQVVVLPTDE